MMYTKQKLGTREISMYLTIDRGLLTLIGILLMMMDHKLELITNEVLLYLILNKVNKLIKMNIKDNA